MAFMLMASNFTFANLAKIFREKALLELEPSLIDNIKALSVTGEPAERIALTEAYLAAHTVGFGPEVPEEIIRLALLIQLHALLKEGIGDAGLILPRLLGFYNREVFPVVCKQSTTVAQAAQLSLPLVGQGKVRYQGYELNAADVLDIFSWKPIILNPNIADKFLNHNIFELAGLTNNLIKLQPIFSWLDYLAGTFAQISPTSPETFSRQIKKLQVDFEALKVWLDNNFKPENKHSETSNKLLQNLLSTLQQVTSILADFAGETYQNLQETSEPPATTSFAVAHDLALYLQQQAEDIGISVATISILNHKISEVLNLLEQLVALNFWAISQVGKVFNLAAENLTLAAYYHSEFFVSKEMGKLQLEKTINFIRITIPEVSS